MEFSFFASLLKMLVALAIVLGIMVGAAYLFRRFMQQTVTGSDDGEAIRILSTRHLGPKSSIMIVDILGQVVAVGLCNQQMTLLTEITDPEAIGRMQDLRVRQTFSPPALRDFLSRHRMAWPFNTRAGKNRREP